MRIFCKLLRKPLFQEPGCKGPGVFKGTVNVIFGKYLLLTNTLTGGLLLAAGDLIQQEISSYGKESSKPLPKRYDWKRVGRMFAVGLVLGPPQHFFYQKLDIWLPERDRRTVSIKVLLDQTTVSPVCISLFFYGIGFLEGNDWCSIKAELENKFWTVYTMDWMIWPAVQAVNFYFLPSKYRVMYINVVTTLYNVFLSYVKHEIDVV